MHLADLVNQPRGKRGRTWNIEPKVREQTASTTRPSPRFKVGELVRRRIKHSRNKNDLRRKWWPQWSETYRVIDNPSWGTYMCAFVLLTPTRQNCDPRRKKYEEGVPARKLTLITCFIPLVEVWSPRHARNPTLPFVLFVLCFPLCSLLPTTPLFRT